MTANFDLGRKVANAILYEGYLLYPYRASAVKNRVRWQFGVLVPRAQAEAGWPEPWFQQAEFLLEPAENPQLRVMVRFLQFQARQVEGAEAGGFRPVPFLEAGGARWLAFDEAVEREVDFVVPLGSLAGPEGEFGFGVDGDEVVEPLRVGGETVGRVVRRRWAVSGRLGVAVEPVAGPARAVKVRVRLENVTAWADPAAERAEVLKRSLLAAHLLMAVKGGAFVSLLDPLPGLEVAAEGCRNVNTFPVLLGEPGQRDLLLAAPIILYDYPVVAPESPTDLFDATEIDELLTLRILTLTDEEKREARATDPRAAALLDLLEALGPEVLTRLHGAVRDLRPAAPAEGEAVEVGGVRVGRGSRVRLRPRPGADAHDMFLAGRVARVEAVLPDVDGRVHLAVTLEDDPAADLYRETGRFLYFGPDEVEPLGGGA